MRIMALDVGDKTIGVAVSDELLIAANGITTIERIGIRKDCGKIMDLINMRYLVLLKKDLNLGIIRNIGILKIILV